MDDNSSKRHPPALLIWLTTLVLLSLSAVTAWAKPATEALRWTVPTYTPTPTPDTGVLCVSVYHDRNRDGLRQPSEELLPGAQIVIHGANSGSPLSQVTVSDQNPCCFPGLAPDLYVVVEHDPAGYFSTTENIWGAVISPNVSIMVPFGDVPGASRLTLPLILNSS